MTTNNLKLPVSPHIFIYKPQLSSTLSILHRFTGIVLAIITIYFFWAIHLELDNGLLNTYEFINPKFSMHDHALENRVYVQHHYMGKTGFIDHSTDVPGQMDTMIHTFSHFDWEYGVWDCYYAMKEHYNHRWPYFYYSPIELFRLGHHYLISVFVGALIYHILHGIRHFYWDSGLGLEKEKWNLLGGIILGFYTIFAIYNLIALYDFLSTWILFVDEFPVFTLISVIFLSVSTILAIKLAIQHNK